MARTFIFSWKSTQPALFNCVALGALKSFAKFLGKHLWQGLSFNKLANCRLAALLKKRLQHRCFHVNFTTFLRTAFSQNGNYHFCNKRSTETSFKNGGRWVAWFEHWGNGFTPFRTRTTPIALKNSARNTKLLFLFLPFIFLFSWHFDFFKSGHRVIIQRILYQRLFNNLLNYVRKFKLSNKL